MVFDRRFMAASPRYLGSASNAQQQNDGLCLSLKDHCVLLARSFLMVLDSKCGGSPGALETVVKGSLKRAHELDGLLVVEWEQL